MLHNDEQVEAYQTTITEQQRELECLRMEVALLQSKIEFMKLEQEYWQTVTVPTIMAVPEVNNNRFALSEYLDDCQH